MVRAAIDTAVVLFAAALLHAPLFLGLNTTTTDHFIHYRWASQFAESLASGIWRPSWEATSRGGLGDPVFLFYPPVFYYAVAALDAVFRDIWLSIRMVLLLSSVATGVGVLLVARARGVSDLIARSLVVLSAASPMLLGISGYINAYPWYVATTVLVFAIIALQRAISRAFIRDYAVLAGLIGLIGLIHSLTAMMFAFTVFLSVMFEWLRSGFRHTRDWVGLGAALALGLSISAVSLYPALSLMDLVSPEAWLETPGASWTNTFAFPLATDSYRTAISYIVPAFLIGFMAVLLVLCRQIRPVARDERILIGMALISLILASELSYPLWRSIELLQFVQRPFRFLATATSIFPVALLVLALRMQRAGGLLRKRAEVLTAVLTLACVVTVSLLQIRSAAIVKSRPDQQVATTQALRGEVYFTPEHLYRGAGPAWSTYLDEGGWAGECEREGAICEAQHISPEHFVWKVALSKPARLSFPLIAFPGWSLDLNGTPISRTYDAASGLVRIDLPPGESALTAQWRQLPEQRTGKTITVAALVLLSGLWWIGRRPPRPSAVPHTSGATATGLVSPPDRPA